MSFHALGWAAAAKVTRAADKLVLLGLADRHNTEHGLAYPSLAWLCEFSSLDRKTVVTALDRLERDGLISDSGKRVGKTRQVKAYILNLNGPENGMVKTEPFAANSSDFSVEQSQKRNSEPVLNQKEAKASYQVVVDLWNELSKRSGIPEVRVLNNSRKQLLNARIKEHGPATMLDAVRKVHASPFCRGQEGDGRKADIMLILQPKTLPRVLEGFYREDKPKAPAKPMTAAEMQNAIRFHRATGNEDRAGQLEAELADRTRKVVPIGQLANDLLRRAG